MDRIDRQRLYAERMKRAAEAGATVAVLRYVIEQDAYYLAVGDSFAYAQVLIPESLAREVIAKHAEAMSTEIDPKS